MEKYKSIRQLMAEGEFRKALDHIARILQKNPEDKEARQLEYTCREMIHIQNACKETPEQKKAISVEEYLSVHFRRIMKTVCRKSFLILNKLPAKWQKRFHADKFRIWEIRFTIDTDSQKDWLWEILFWDTRRRVIVFSSLVTIILLFATLFMVLVFRGCDIIETHKTDREISEIVRAAQEDEDLDAQYILGKKYYYGEGVKRDVDQALFWLTKSARSDHKKAAELLQKILVEQDIQVSNGQFLWKEKKKKPYSQK